MSDQGHAGKHGSLVACLSRCNTSSGKSSNLKPVALLSVQAAGA